MMVPSFEYIDVIMLAYRLGYVRYDEQKVAMIMAAREATDALTFMTALEKYGISSRTQLHKFAGKVLAAPAYYRSQYPLILGLRKEGQAAEPFLKNLRALQLVEGILTIKQYDLYSDAYWWFVHNHQPVFFDAKRGQCIGVYATDSQDNDSTLDRFDDYLQHLVNHKSKTIRERFEGFPADIVTVVLKRAFCT